MNSKGLTLTIIFKAQSLNYGEGIGNWLEVMEMYIHLLQDKH